MKFLYCLLILREEPVFFRAIGSTDYGVRSVLENEIRRAIRAAGDALRARGGCPTELARGRRGVKRGRAALAMFETVLLRAVSRVLEVHAESVSSVCVTADGVHVVTASSDTTARVRVWSMADGALVRELKGHTSDVTSVCVTADGAHVVTGSWDKTARVWLWPARGQGAQHEHLIHLGKILRGICVTIADYCRWRRACARRGACAPGAGPS